MRVYKLTKAKRLKIYERALELISKPDIPKSAFPKALKPNIISQTTPTSGLCLLLPCIWLNCGVLDEWKDNEGGWFNFMEVPKYFPEFGRYYANRTYKCTREHRIDVLTACIFELLSQLH